MPFDFSRLAPTLVLVGLGLIAFIQLRRAFARATDTAREPRSHGPKASDPDSLHSAATSASIDRWEVSLHETLREFQGRVDTKLAALQTLCRLAEQAADRLERAVKRAEELGLAERTDPLETIARLAADVRQASSPVALPPLLTAEEALPRTAQQRHQIQQLAAEGLSPNSIAARTGIPLGDVELILSLPPAKTS